MSRSATWRTAIRTCVIRIGIFYMIREGDAGWKMSLPPPILKAWAYEHKTRLGHNESVHNEWTNRVLYRVRHARSNSPIPCSFIRFQSRTVNPTNIEGPKTYIVSETSLVKLVGKCTSTAATVSGSKGNHNPRRGETNRVAHSG